MNQLAVDWEHHDRFIAPSYTTWAWASLPIGGADVYALWMSTAAGSNGAHRGRTIAAGDGEIRIALKRARALQSVGPMRSRSRGRFGSH